MKNLKSKIITSIFASVLFFNCTLKSEAQSTEFGIRLMPTFSSFNMQTSTGGTVNGSVNLGFGCGAFLGFNISDNVGIQGELIYNSLSQRYTETDVERKVKLRYINVPVLLSLNTGKSRPFNINFVAGPQIGFSVGSSLSTNGTNNPPAILSVRKGDLGIAYGAGIDFGINNSLTTRFGFGFRGVLGLFDISDNSQTIATDSYYILDRSRIKTYSAYVGVSFLF